MAKNSFQDTLRKFRRVFEGQDVPEDLEDRLRQKLQELGVRPIQIYWTGYAGDPKAVQIQFHTYEGEVRIVRKIRFSRDLEVLLDETDSNGPSQAVRLGIADRQRSHASYLRRQLGEDN